MGTPVPATIAHQTMLAKVEVSIRAVEFVQGQFYNFHTEFKTLKRESECLLSRLCTVVRKYGVKGGDDVRKELKPD